MVLFYVLYVIKLDIVHKDVRILIGMKMLLIIGLFHIN